MCMPGREMGKYLDTAGSHVELGSQLLAERRVGLGVILVHALEDLELGAGGALAMLDLVRGVRVECADIDLGGVHAGGNECGDARLVLLVVVWMEGVGVVEVVESRLLLLLLQMLKAGLRAGEGVRVVVHGVLWTGVVGEDVVESGLVLLLVLRVLVVEVEVGVVGGGVGGKIVRWDVCVVRVLALGDGTGVGEHLNVGRRRRGQEDREDGGVGWKRRGPGGEMIGRGRRRRGDGRARNGRAKGKRKSSVYLMQQMTGLQSPVDASLHSPG